MAKGRARKNKLITKYPIDNLGKTKGVKPTIDFSPGLGKIKGVKRRPGVARAKRLATQAAKRRADGPPMPKLPKHWATESDSRVAHAKARREAALPTWTGGIGDQMKAIREASGWSKPLASLTGKPKRRVAKKLTPSQKATSLAKRLAARREKGFKEGSIKGGTIWSPKKKPGKPKRRKK